MQGIYKLVGILNLFNVIPDFIYLVFERNKQYYLLTGDEETLRIKEFVPVKNSAIGRIIKLSYLNTNEIQQVDFTKESKPIFGFQVSDTEVFLGFFEEIKEFLQNFETQDEILKEEISDFLSAYEIKQ